MCLNLSKKEYWHKLNPFQPGIAFYIETSYLICPENQITGFSMKYNTEPKWVK